MYRHLSYNNRQLHYESLGDGPAVVLLHGFGEDGSVWDFQKDRLAQHFKILIPHLPGSGGSELIADMRMEGLADAVHYLLQQERVAHCAMIGHSMGGYVALAFAEKYPTMLKGLGLFHSSAYADTDEKKATRKKGIAFIREHGAHEFLKTSIPNLYSPATKETAPALIKEQIDAVHYFSSDALIAYYEAMIQRPDRTSVLRQIAVPVLFVLGKWDTAVPLESGLEQCSLPQIAYIHVLDASGHMGMAEEPEKSFAIMHQYISETLGVQ